MKKTRFLLYVLLLALLALYMKDRMLMTAFATRQTAEVYSVSSIVVLALDAVLGFLYLLKLPKFNSLGRRILFFLSYVFIISLLFYQGSRLGMMLSVLPLLMFLGFKSLEDIFYSRLFYLVYFVFSLFVTYFFFELHTFMQLLGNDDFVMNSVFSVVYLLPLMFCANTRALGKLSYFKWIFLALTVVAILYSSKRSPFISVFGAMGAYYYINQIKFGNNSPTKLFQIFGVVLIAYVGLQLMFANSDLHILERLSTIQSDEGSGRIEVWGMALKVISESDFFHLLIGHGTDSLCTAPGNYMGYPAHNDFLECTYDYGLVGLFLYLSVHIGIIKETKKLIKKRSVFAAPMAMSYVIFLVSSMVSHIVLYEYYLIQFCMFWAFIDAESNKQVEY